MRERERGPRGLRKNGRADRRAAGRLWVVRGQSDGVTVFAVADAKAVKSVRVGRVPYGVVMDE